MNSRAMVLYEGFSRLGGNVMEGPEIDWEPMEKYPKSEIECRCGAVYYSHYKAVLWREKLTTITRIPCPRCNASYDHVYRATTQDHMTLRRDDVREINGEGLS